MAFELKYKQFSDASILVEWPQKIDRRVLNDILAFKATIAHSSSMSTIKSITHAYASLLITYAPKGFNYYSEEKHLKIIYKSVEVENVSQRRLWKIPVCYDDSFGIDLEWLSKEKHMSVEAIISKHTNVTYTVYFIGFLPGFLYLGGLNRRLFTPRRATPRLQIEKGAVAIGGEQTGVYPNESPGGWHIIGNSPIRFFDVSKNIPCFAQAGDGVRFYPVSLKDYKTIATLVNANTYEIESEVLDG